ncbi:hypothetical protein [Meridianimarinicoccus aquatilis]|uniref:Uncharacterized protein n=1 Tax=Meridianimarinicoccus aquatilis TaxID=2552766 RepID=A0A4R6B5E4_9RHOB|nr:hypothetical protein [Fluviibacterium aquatile]TDL90673.1 hypothetical protein E2L05_03920 [Fluviibacterium aquatile]
MSAYELGRAAYSHAKYTLVIGANNQADNMKKTGGWAGVAVDRSRYTGERWVKHNTGWEHDGVKWVKKRGTWKLEYPTGKIQRPSTATSNHDFYLELAERAKTHRAGNCGENAAVVYAYLFEKAQGAGIGKVQYISCKEPNDHCFVLIGDKWDGGSIVVDPWWGVMCTGDDVVYQTGRCFFSEDDDPHDMQAYVAAHGVDVMASFDT